MTPMIYMFNQFKHLALWTIDCLFIAFVEQPPHYDSSLHFTVAYRQYCNLKGNNEGIVLQNAAATVAVILQWSQEKYVFVGVKSHHNSKLPQALCAKGKPEGYENGPHTVLM